jgi:NitT/TauT family transport system substrate-binding protein
VRRLAGVAAVLLALAVPAGAEPRQVRIAVAGTSAVYLPLWLAAERTLQEEAVVAEVVQMHASAVAQAVVGASADIGVTSLATLVLAIQAGHPVTAFYAGFAHADAEWFGRPGIRGWADLRGKRVGVAAMGGLTEGLTALVLRRHGLEPGRDVHLVLAGGAARLAALEAGRVDATILPAPAKWEAEERGLPRLGSQRAEVGPAWPRALFWARTRLLGEQPDLARAVLRAHVRAVRLLRADRELAIGTIERRWRYRRAHAERAYEELVADLDERGRLPDRGLAAFWQSAMAAGDVRAPWPEVRFFDRRFVDSFDDWAPR